ncbi:MAG: glycosyltransferase family 1 protein [Pseudomonadota bacterium]
MAGVWTINGDFAALKPTGVARYAEQTVRALDRLAEAGDPAVEGLDLTLLVKRGADRTPNLKAIRIVEAADLRPRLPQGFVQIVIPMKMKGGLVSLCNYGPIAVSKQILCVHDLHSLQFPDSYSRAFREFNRIILPRLGRRIAAIATVSEFSRSEIAAHKIAPFEKVFVTYNGHEHVYEEPSDGAPEVRDRPYVLSIGRDLKYKNTEMMFAIAPALADAGVDIALAGSFDPARYGEAIPANMRILGRVSDAELFRLMRGAAAFLFPSRIEGFGLPAVEAMAMDCPLIVSDAPCLPEIVGDAARVIDPDDVAGWAKAAIELAMSHESRDALIALGRERRRKFSWATIARQYAAKMRSIDKAAG